MKLKHILISLVIIISLTSCYFRIHPHSRYRVWIPAHYGPNGSYYIGGWYWVHSRRHAHWENRYRDHHGKWKRGRWIWPQPHPGSYWVPGHYGPRGRWVKGKWSTKK